MPTHPADPCPSCLRPCELHGISRCATCHKHAGECDYGACDEPAAVTFDYGFERRLFCTAHATEPRFGFLHDGAVIVAEAA